MNVNYLKYKNKSKIKLNKGPVKLTLLSIFCALAIGISYLESLVPLLPVFPPGVKPGFANIITMFVCSCFGIFPSVCIVLIKSIFAALTRGFIAFLMSFFGGIFSTLITGLLIRFIPFSLNYMYVGIIGAGIHNITQIIVASIIIGNIVFYYLPILILFSIITGSITGLILNIVLPILYKLYDYT